MNNDKLKIKVLMTGPKLNAKGGIATVVNNYLKSELTEKVYIKYIPSACEGNKLKKLVYGLISYIRIFFQLIFGNVSLVHVHMASRKSFYRKSVIIKMARLFKCRIVIHLHGAEFYQFYNDECNAKQKKYVSKIFNSSDLVIALSEQWREKICEFCGSNVKVLYNAVNIPDNNKYNFESIYISLIGRIEKRKGVYDFVTIIDEIHNAYPEIRIQIVGDGEIDKLREIINKYKLDKFVEVNGWMNKTEINCLLSKTKVYVLPSYDEGMPMALLEAMSYGIPVITTDVGGIPTVVSNEKNGFIIKPGDTQSLKKYLLQLLENKELAQNIGESGYKSVKANFGLKSNINSLYNMYLDVIKNSGM